uniref:Uncharacterized protein n=1 Tax=Candidatus Kentrum sp. LPFa TaxID=2126335 RepID=A0A450X4S3_9GAMM|nr:MAG: hypothetical protein BECKLPF1236B_GA0070989_13982 [Candidatus Kentron sp. LPFa]
MNYIITGGNFTSHLLQELNGDFPIEILTEQELQESDISFHKEDKLFLPSQSSLDLVMERMDCPERLHAIEQLTDKYRCRSLMRSLFPDFEFRELELSDMQEEMFSPERKYVETFARWHFQQFIVIRKNFPEKRTEKSGL